MRHTSTCVHRNIEQLGAQARRYHCILPVLPCLPERSRRFAMGNDTVGQGMGYHNVRQHHPTGQDNLYVGSLPAVRVQPGHFRFDLSPYMLRQSSDSIYHRVVAAANFMTDQLAARHPVPRLIVEGYTSKVPAQWAVLRQCSHGAVREGSEVETEPRRDNISELSSQTLSVSVHAYMFVTLYLSRAESTQ